MISTLYILLTCQLNLNSERMYVCFLNCDYACHYSILFYKGACQSRSSNNECVSPVVLNYNLFWKKRFLKLCSYCRNTYYIVMLCLHVVLPPFKYKHLQGGDHSRRRQKSTQVLNGDKWEGRSLLT